MNTVSRMMIKLKFHTTLNILCVPLGTLCLVFLHACHSATRKDIIRDTVTRDIPSNIELQGDWVSAVRNTEKQIGLDSLKGGGDSIQIRFWAGGNQGIVNFMAVVKKSRGHFTGEFYNYDIDRDRQGKELMINISKTSFKVVESFFDRLAFFD